MKNQLIEQIKKITSQTPKDAILMVLSGSADTGSADGVLISSEKFDDVANTLIELFDLSPDNTSL